jgi:hypothetical protein
MSALSPNPAEARKVMEDAAFTRHRLCTALPRLRERLREIEAQEEDARRLSEYEAAERTATSWLRSWRTYPTIVATLVYLLARIDSNDRRMEHHQCASAAERSDAAAECRAGGARHTRLHVRRCRGSPAGAAGPAASIHLR